MLPPRGLSIDPSRPLGPQRVGTTVQMPFKWLEIFSLVARNANMSKSKLICVALQEFAEKHDIELPPYV